MDKDNKNNYSEDGVLYSTILGKKILTCYPAAKQGESFTVSEDVHPGVACFASPRYLKEVIFAPKGVLSDAFPSFYRCKDLKVIIPDTIVDPSKGDESDLYDSYYSEWNPFLDCENLVLRGKNNAWAKEYVKTHEGVTYEEIDVISYASWCNSSQ